MRGLLEIIMKKHTDHDYLAEDDVFRAGATFISGNRKNNTLNGNDSRNVMDGGRGNDTLNGHGGNDKLYGGRGNDHLDGGAGADVIIGDSGTDTLVLEGGDIARGGAGLDTFIIKGDGHIRDFIPGETLVVDDVSYGWRDLQQFVTEIMEDAVILTLGERHVIIDHVTDFNAPTLVVGNRKDNVLHGEDGKNLIYGGAGNDMLYGHGDIDGLFGGAGNDYLDGGDTEDLMDGEAGDDTVVMEGDGDDGIGGTGNDTFIIKGIGWGRISDFEQGDVISHEGTVYDWDDLQSYVNNGQYIAFGGYEVKIDNIYAV